MEIKTIVDIIGALLSPIICAILFGDDYSGLNVPLVAVCNVPPIAFSNVPPQKWLL